MIICINSITMGEGVEEDEATVEEEGVVGDADAHRDSNREKITTAIHMATVHMSDRNVEPLGRTMSTRQPLQI